jgi:hypothetical protein
MSKSKQEAELGVSSATVMSAGTSSVITRKTADSVNQYLDYYEQVFDRYGFLLVTAAGFEGDDSQKKDGGARARRFQATLNNYSKTMTIAESVPGAFPAGRLYTVKQHVSPFNKTIYTCAVLTGCGYTDEVQGHALGGSRDPICLVQMRPMNSKPAWDSSFETWMYADSSMPRNYFKHVHDTYAKGSVDYPWATRSLTGSRATYYYGWGALVHCDSTAPASSARMLDPAGYHS